MQGYFSPAYIDKHFNISHGDIAAISPVLIGNVKNNDVVENDVTFRSVAMKFGLNHPAGNPDVTKNTEPDITIILGQYQIVGTERIALFDKIHNAYLIVNDYRANGLGNLQDDEKQEYEAALAIYKDSRFGNKPKPV